jgi:hypothetical protein
MIRGRAGAISARIAGVVSGAASMTDRPAGRFTRLGAFQADRTRAARGGTAGGRRRRPRDDGERTEWNDDTKILSQKLSYVKSLPILFV